VNASIIQHGNRQFELSVEYPLQSKHKKSNHILELFLFSPYQLVITPERYGVKNFLKDIHSYTRYTTPELTFSEIIDPSCEASPLTRIKKILPHLSSLTEEETRILQYEIRMLINIYRHQLKIIRKTIQQMDQVTAQYNIATYLNDLDVVLKLIREEVILPLLNSSVSKDLSNSASWADESASWFTEKQLLRLYDYALKINAMGPILVQLCSRIKKECEYRKTKGFKIITNQTTDKENEKFVYHEGMLKKWAEGCMFMSAAKNKLPEHIAQILMGVAAGIAMLFAVLATVQVTKMFSPDSATWAMLIVGMYIFKDRIKELLRLFFAKHLPDLIADKSEDIIDFLKAGTYAKVGNSKVRVRFLSASSIPQAITDCRQRYINEFHSILPKENVIEFHKELNLNCQQLLHNHKRIRSITEILRLNIGHFLTEMDDDIEYMPCHEDMKYNEISVRRCYHLHAILRLSDSYSNDTKIIHYLILLNRTGIVRIEEIERKE
jgi:hypothetical protein